MSYLVVMTPSQHVMHTKEPSELEGMRQQLARARETGVVVAAWGLVSGGAVYVVEADSNAALADVIRRFPLFHTSHVEVTPLVDMDDLLSMHHQRALQR